MFVHSPRFCLQSVVNSFNVIAPLNLIVPGLKRMIRGGQSCFWIGLDSVPLSAFADWMTSPPVLMSVFAFCVFYFKQMLWSSYFLPKLCTYWNLGVGFFAGRHLLLPLCLVQTKRVGNTRRSGLIFLRHNPSEDVSIWAFEPSCRTLQCWCQGLNNKHDVLGNVPSSLHSMRSPNSAFCGAAPFVFHSTLRCCSFHYFYRTPLVLYGDTNQQTSRRLPAV